VAVRLVLECDPAGDPSVPGMLQLMIPAGLADPRIREAAQQAGVSYTGSTTLDGSDVVADYVVNIQGLLARF